MTYETLKVDKEGAVAIVTLNRPEHLNALNTVLFRELGEALNELEDDNQINVVMFTGSGRAFSAGADIHEMVETPAGAARVTGAVTRGDWLTRLIDYKKPTIGIINGLAYGGGALLASCCDIRLGCENTSFRFLAITYGRINATWSLPLIVGLPKAKELLLTGRIVKAEEAAAIGLLNQIVPAAELMKTARDMGQLIAKNDAHTAQVMRKILNENIGLNHREALANEMKNIAESLTPPPPKESFNEFLNRKSRPQ